MQGFAYLLLFAAVPLAAMVIGTALYSRGARILLLCFVVPLIGLVAGIIWVSSRGFLAGAANYTGLAYFAVLSLLGLADPQRFFWAFRAVCGGLFTVTVVNAVMATLADANRLRSVFQGSSGDASGEWLAVIVLGLPCLWFYMKGRGHPPKQRMHVIMNRSQLPTLTLWQEELRRWGIELVLNGADNLNVHAGRMEVVLQGNPTGFEFDVAPVEQLVENYEITEVMAGALGDDCVSANFRYTDEGEQLAAQIAAAALTKLTAGRLYTLEPEAWIDGDDAIEIAHDTLQPHELHVLLMDERVPTLGEWQQALQPAGLALEVESSTDLRKLAGYVPVVVQGQSTGFVFSLLPADFVVGGDRFPGAEAPREVFRLTKSVNFRFAEGPAAAAAARAAAAFARIADGIVFDPQRMVFLGSDGTVLTPPPTTTGGDTD